MPPPAQPNPRPTPPPSPQDPAEPTRSASLTAADAAVAAQLAAAMKLLRINRSANPVAMLGSVPDSPRLAALLARHPDKFADLLEDPARFRLQILVGHAAHLQPITHHGYRVDAEYFYPASTVKLCSAVAAAEVLNELHLAGIAVNRRSPYLIHPLAALDGGAPYQYQPPPLRAGDTYRSNPPNTFDGVARDIRRALVVSDNPAHNRLYEFVGHEAINKLMWRAGLPTVRINHRVTDFRPADEHRRTAQIDFFAGGEIAYTVPQRTSKLLVDNASFPGLAGLLVGRAHVDPLTGVERDTPMDFTGKNRIGLLDLHKLLARQLHFDPRLGPRCDYADADLCTLMTALTTSPAENCDLLFERPHYPEHEFKWYAPGLARLSGGRRIGIANKVGRAYGFSTDTSMIFPLSGNRESLFITATIFTCAGGVINNDSYEYDRADRFFADLGEVVAHEFWHLKSRRTQ